MSTATIELTGVNQHRLQVARDSLLARELDKALDWQLKDYTLFTTNLSHCLPEVAPQRHWNYYLNLLCYRDLLLNEHQNHERVGALLTQEDSTSEGYTGPLPAIFTSFHFGSYRSIVGILVHQRIDFVMVINDELYTKEEQRIRETVAKVQAALGTNIFFDLLNAESPDAALKMSGYLMKNISIAVFADGNTGVGGAYRKDAALARIDFLGQPIFVRRGVGVLSKITRKPIVPLVLYYPDSALLAPVVVFHDPIDNTEKSADYVDDAMRRLYAVLEEHVRQRPDQWQGWLYFHKFLDIDTLRTTNQLTAPEELIFPHAMIRFNADRYGIFKMDSGCFLFDRMHYLTYPIEQELFTALREFLRNEHSFYFIRQQVGRELTKLLWDNQIIRPVGPTLN